MWVAPVVPVPVVDRRDIACDTACQLLGECPRQSLSLLGCAFDGQGDDEPFANTPFAFLRRILGLLRCRGVRWPCQAIPQHLTSCFGPRDIPQMCGGLPNLRCSSLGGALLRKCLY